MTLGCSIDELARISVILMRLPLNPLIRQAFMLLMASIINNLRHHPAITTEWVVGRAE